MLNPGARLGSFEIAALLGAGGMGEVYRARDTRFRRDVAIKVLPHSLARDPGLLARFEHEARAAAALSHPAIRGIYDIQTKRGLVFAVMELLEGETLRARLKAGRLGRKEAVAYALEVAEGVAAAHDKRIVHRDLKPDNLFVTKDGHVKILDFGLARSDPALSAPDEGSSAPTATRHTQPGTVMGTLEYMSPEQVKGRPVDHHSDVFSFGAVLYEMLTGQQAFQRGSAAETMAAILLEEPPTPDESRKAFTPDLERIVRRCLEKSPEKRFQSVRDI